MTIDYRSLSRDELHHLIDIDRSEVAEAMWVIDGQQLLRRAQHSVHHGWSPEEVAERVARLERLLGDGGAVYGAFYGDSMVGVASLRREFFGVTARTLQLFSLHVSASYRGQGIGRHLMTLCMRQARQWGAEKLYISGSNVDNAVRFYQHMGCVPATEINPELFALEPDDIHWELRLQ